MITKSPQKHNDAASHSVVTTPLLAGLYLVSTPIGNLGDMTFRAVDTLKRVDLIACEDTRVAAKISMAFEIKTQRIRFDAHQSAAQIERLVAQIKGGKSLALISDAGTPLISDPGHSLVARAIEQGVQVIAIPGACAVLTALVPSGLPTDRFIFCGFIERQDKARVLQFSEVASCRATLIYYESPLRLKSSMQKMREVFGDRQAVVARELTKFYETFYRGTITQVLDKINNDNALKGECVVMIAPAQERLTEKLSESELDQLLLRSMTQMSLRDAVQSVYDSQENPKSLTKRAIFSRALTIANNQKL